MKKKLFLLFCLFTLMTSFGCTGPAIQTSTRPKSSTPPPLPKNSDSASIDLLDLQRDLRLNRKTEDLGFVDRAFDPCKFGVKSSPQCDYKTFTVLHFRIQCRDSEGSVNHVSQFELEPLARQKLKWKVGLVEGSLETDPEGFGQIRFIAPGSSKNQKLILISQKQALGLKVSEVSRIIVPRDWCHRI